MIFTVTNLGTTGPTRIAIMSLILRVSAIEQTMGCRAKAVAQVKDGIKFKLLAKQIIAVERTQSALLLK